LGLTLAQISETTRIGTRFLKAIESDDFGVLPEGIYTRSFIRSYAKQVRMDEELALQLYQEQTGTVEALADPTAPVDEQPFVYKEPSNSFWPALAVALALALVLATGSLAFYRYVQKNQGSGEVATTVQTPPPVDTAPAGTSEPPVQNIADARELKVTLHASDKCWIGYTTDGGKRTQLQLESGQSEQISATESIDLSIGNTRVISMQINGRDAHFPEDTGVVLKTLTITPESAQALVN
jgi:cytoskeletal protein RodZ